MIKTRRSNITFPRMNKDMAYLAGVIVGDGSMSRTKRKVGGRHYIITICANTKDYLNYINSLFQKYFNYIGGIYKDKRHEVYNLCIQSAPIYLYFKIVIFGNKKNWKKSIPKSISSRKVYIKEYISGLSDTDGSINKVNKIIIKQKSRNLLYRIAEFLNSENISCSYPKVNYTNGVPYYYIMIAYKLPLRLKMPA